MNYKPFFFFYYIIIIVIQGFSLPLNSLVDSNRKTALLNQGTILETQLKNPKPLLIPQYSFVQNLVHTVMAELEPSLFVETLHLYKKAPAAGFPIWREAERQALFNRALALSSLTGIQYYSTSRKTMRTLYEISTVIDGPDTKRPLPDPVYSPPPQELVIFARQKDLTFGDNIYQYTYYAFPEGLAFIQQNLTPLVAGIVPAVGKNKLRSVVAVLDAEEYLLIYLASMAKAASFPGMNQRVSQSFSTRADAILQWITAQADKAFAP
ncbi:MAG: hypothetical protein LBD29_09625 [Treponema sp.]|jgi:hypothetical protein|nr:hypothetical protein [Treponema sp.]